MNTEPHKNVMKELREFLGNKFKNDDLYESCKIVSKTWNDKTPRSEEEYLDFYKSEKDYVFEIANWNATPRRRSLFKKLLRVITTNNIQEIIDFGAGTGSDTLALHELGFNVKYLEINKTMKEFFKYRCDKRGIEVPIIEKLEPTECIIFTDVIEHFQNPFSYLESFSHFGKSLLFTQSFGEHDEKRGGMPYHTNHSMKDIHNFLGSVGYKKVKLDIVIPPYFYIKKEVIK